MNRLAQIEPQGPGDLPTDHYLVGASSPATLLKISLLFSAGGLASRTDGRPGRSLAGRLKSPGDDTEGATMASHSSHLSPRMRETGVAPFELHLAVMIPGICSPMKAYTQAIPGSLKSWIEPVAGTIDGANGSRQSRIHDVDRCSGHGLITLRLNRSRSIFFIV
jgi:hypothetical protein